MKNLNLMSKRYYMFALSAVLILAGVLGILINGFQWDIQFEGGTILKIEMPDDTFDTDAIEEQLQDEIKKDMTVQKSSTFNPENDEDKIDILVLKVSKSETLTDTEINQVYEFLRTNYNVSENAETSVLNIEPFIGAEMKRSALLAAAIASILMVLYIWQRFSVMSGLPAALFAIAALIHDALIMLSVYTVFKIPVNESFVAAVLTILGYSMNDTIIIYDRIRENTRFFKKGDYEGLVNKSIVQVLNRSINTLATTLLCIVTVYIFAVANNIESIKNFSFPLIIGLISGTYSSIFIAGPLWMMWKKSKLKMTVR